MKKTIALLIISIASFAFVQFTGAMQNDEPEFIPPSPQRSGNAAIGYEYLTTGDYLKSGIPYSLFSIGIPKDTNNFLKRSCQGGKNTSEPKLCFIIQRTKQKKGSK